MHQPVETSETPGKGIVCGSDGELWAPDTKSDDTAHDRSGRPKMRRPWPQRKAPRQHSLPCLQIRKRPPKIPEPTVLPAAAEINKPPQKTAAPFVTSAANSLKSTLESQLAVFHCRQSENASNRKYR